MLWLMIAVVLVVAVVAFIATRPANYRIVRHGSISAPADTVFGYINDFHKWPVWSPWEKLDPDMKRSHAGPTSGVGSRYTWSGNRKAGAGSMEITDSVPNQRIAIDLQFERPFKARNPTEFTFAPSADGVKVTWTITGHNNFIAKAFCVFVDMDQTVGKDFEQGLATLKTAAEADAARVRR